ncbi:MAG: fused MFS/spermidine synthase [Myxococcales bacterium]|nr:fused MFS/spermidine synthase [Myxococcales bacterium]
MLVFAATIGVGACLLFQVQFILGKQILPWFGGAPAVWTTCMLFFQVLLLAGYGYAHLLGRSPSPLRQRNIHLGMLLLALALLLVRVLLWPSPITPSDEWKPGPDDLPSLAILGLLLFTIGLPFLVLSSTGPLLQAWYARCFPGASPYRLYALSNLGSLLGLLSYPFLLEPALSVTDQGWVWSAGFVVFVVGCAGAAVLVGRTEPATTRGASEAEAPAADAPPPTVAERALWLVLAMVASVMLLAVTSQISLEVAVIPFLWMLPLALYLLSFVLCFEYEGSYRRGLWIPLLLLGAGGTTVVILEGVGVPMLVQLVTYLSVLLFACMVCHGELVRRKPAPRYLTSFYLLVSAGGAAGGVFTGLVAPATFLGLWELPLALVAACVLALALGLFGGPTPRLHRVRMSAAWVGGAYLVVLAVMLGRDAVDDLSDNVHVSRGFFGVLRVDEDEDLDGEERMRLRHGRIIHGLQYTDPELALEPTSYYGPGSGVGLAIGTHPRRKAGEPMTLGFVGLGAGTLACYVFEGDHARFYEIDPDVVALSSGSSPLFTYLRDARGEVEVAIGDARINLEREPPRGFDVLALDAFSSDAIPTHLLTVEAMELYLEHLRDADSLIAVHISNRYLDLEPVVQGLAEELGLAVIRIDDDHEDERVFSSDWMLLATQPGAFEGVRALADPAELAPKQGEWPLWTDTYSNLVQVLK